MTIVVAARWRIVHTLSLTVDFNNKLYQKKCENETVNHRK
jgi:hypothetical protein